MALFGSNQASYLGIDLSNDSIKVVELENDRGKPKLITYGYTEAPAGVLRGDFIDNKHKTSALLKEVCKQAGTVSTNALTSLPNTIVFSTIVSLHDVLVKDIYNPHKIKKMIGEEFSKIAPLPLEEMFYIPTLVDIDLLEKAKEEKVRKIKTINYLVVAASLKIIKKYSDIFKQAGLNLVKLDVEAFCQIRSLIGRDPSNILLVDVGENVSSIMIVSKGLPILKRTLNIGGTTFTQYIADHLKLELPQAEQNKIDLSITYRPGGEFPEFLEAVVNPLINEIEYLVKLYKEKAQTNSKLIEKIILTGGGSLLPNLSTHISRKTNLPTYLGDPWARIVYPEDVFPLLREVGPRFSVSIGLAMEQILK